VPPFPDYHTLFVMLVTAFALYLFTRDRLPLEASGLTILIVLIISFEIFPYGPAGERLGAGRLLAGFGNEALVTVCALMIVGKGMETTGALQPLALWLARAWTVRPMLASLATMGISAVLRAGAGAPNTQHAMQFFPTR
jgi:di/tricarboxylate transporter